MGFHIITRQNTEKCSSIYVNHLDDLVKHNEIAADSVVYEADPAFKPVLLYEHPILQDYCNIEKRLTRRAEMLFEQLAIQQGYVVQRINQDEFHHARYRELLGEHPKRSDYLVMNIPNTEVDVHCLATHLTPQGEFYYLDKQAIDLHVQTIKKIHRHLIFLIFQRNRDGSLAEPYGMITVEQLIKCPVVTHENKLQYRFSPKQLVSGLRLLDKFSHGMHLTKNEYSWQAILKKTQLFFARHRLLPIYLFFGAISFWMFHHHFPWISQFKQQFEIIFISSLAAFLLGRQWR